MTMLVASREMVFANEADERVACMDQGEFMELRR